MAGAGGDLVAECLAEIILIGAGKDQSLLLSFEVKYGFNFLLSGVRVQGRRGWPLVADYGGSRHQNG